MQPTALSRVLKPQGSLASAPTTSSSGTSRGAIPQPQPNQTGPNVISFNHLG